MFSSKQHILTYLFCICLLTYYRIHDIIGLKMLEIPSGDNLLFFILGGLIGVLLPDIDHPRSIAGYIIPLHKIKLKMLGHGRATHTILFSLIFMFLYIKYEHHVFLGLWFGYLVHLVGDNLQGVDLKYIYYPFVKGKNKNKVKRRKNGH